MIKPVGYNVVSKKIQLGTQEVKRIERALNSYVKKNTATFCSKTHLFKFSIISIGRIVEIKTINYYNNRSEQTDMWIKFPKVEIRSNGQDG